MYTNMNGLGEDFAGISSIGDLGGGFAIPIGGMLPDSEGLGQLGGGGDQFTPEIMDSVELALAPLTFEESQALIWMASGRRIMSLADALGKSVVSTHYVANTGFRKIRKELSR